MAEIKVNTGQGVTQAIASNLGMSGTDVKKVKLSVWQEVMKLVDQNNTQQVQQNKSPTFTGTNDVNKIGDKSSYKSNFLAHPNQVMQIDDSIMGKIKQLLTGKSAETTPANTVSKSNPANTTTKTSDTSKAATPTLMSSASEANIVADTPLEGSAETGKAADALFNKMGLMENVKISVISDETSALMSKKNRTPEETQKMLGELHDGMKKLGNSMTKYIDSEFGDGSGKISSDAFLKWQEAGRNEALKASGLTVTDTDKEQFAKDDMVMFNRLDLNKDGKIDNEEMSAFYLAMDFDEKGRSDGAIDTITYNAAGHFTSDPNENNLDAKLKYAYGALYDKQTAE